MYSNVNLAVSSIFTILFKLFKLSGMKWPPLLNRDIKNNHSGFHKVNAPTCDQVDA